MPFLHNCTPKCIISRKSSPCPSDLVFPHLRFVSPTTKNKLNLENDRMLELHKKRLG